MPVEERERLAFTPTEAGPILQRLRGEGLSAVLLSTCNRCELYWWGPDDAELWLRNLANDRGAAPDLPFTRYEGMAAVRHLFRVSAGLDSQILGETEILGQVRRAFDAARAAGTTVPDLDLIFSAALAAGRRVRRESILGWHPASVSSAAVDLVVEGWSNRPGRRVIIMGAGEAAEGVLRALDQHNQAGVMMLSRQPEKAGVLARAWGAEVGPWEDLDRELETADLLVVATAASRPVITATQLTRIAARRNGRELQVVDLAVPRNVEPAARGVEGIQLLDLDDLQRRCCPAVGTASPGLAQAEGVIEEELVRLDQRLRSRMVAPRLAELHRLSHEMAEQESAWALAQLETLSGPEREIVRQMADRLVRRVLYPLSRSLRAGMKAQDSAD